MHSLDAEGEVRNLLPRGAHVRDELPWRKRRGSTAVVDAHQIVCGRVHLMTVERGVRPRNHRPRLRVGRGLACEIAGFELFESGVEFLAAETDPRHDPI